MGSIRLRKLTLRVDFMESLCESVNRHPVEKHRSLQAMLLPDG